MQCVDNYPMKASSIYMHKENQKLKQAKNCKNLNNKKSIRGNIITRVTVPATTTSKKSMKHFKTEESNHSMTPVELSIPNRIAGSTKRIYDRILNNHTALSAQHKRDKQKGTPLSQNYGSKFSVERKDTPDALHMYNYASYKHSLPHQSIDDIKGNDKIKLMKKNKTIESMMLSQTPTLHLKNNYANKTSNSKLYQNY